MATDKKKTQCDRIVQYMTMFGSITPVDALRDLAVMRLASRISDLRKMGYVIAKDIESGLNRFGEPTHYARYTLLYVPIMAAGGAVSV